MAKILVTPRSITKAGGHPSLERLVEAGHEIIMSPAGRLPTENELLELLTGCEGYLAGVERINANVLNKFGDLKVISRNGTGVDTIDLDAAAQLGIKVCRALGGNARGVAELTIGYLFALARSIPFSDTNLKRKEWTRRKGLELQDRTLGLVGCGAIGKLVAEIALGVGMNVRAYDVMQDADFVPGSQFGYATMDEVIEQSDFISLHCPALADGKPILDADVLSRTKKGVFIINTARPNLIDNRALTDAIRSGHVAGAALDVFNEEPPVEDELVQDDHVVATPHIGGFTFESVDRAMNMAVDGLLENLA